MLTEREAIEEMTGKKRIATVRKSKPKKGEHIFMLIYALVLLVLRLN